MRTSSVACRGPAWACEGVEPDVVSRWSGILSGWAQKERGLYAARGNRHWKAGESTKRTAFREGMALIRLRWAEFVPELPPWPVAGNVAGRR